MDGKVRWGGGGRGHLPANRGVWAPELKGNVHVGNKSEETSRVSTSTKVTCASWVQVTPQGRTLTLEQSGEGVGHPSRWAFPEVVSSLARFPFLLTAMTF